MDNHFYFAMGLAFLALAVIALPVLSAVCSRLSLRLRQNKLSALVWYLSAFFFCFFLFWLCNNHRFNNYNNFSYLAESLLQGRLDVPELPEYLESVSFKGKTYMHFAPGPSLLSLPFVAAFGIQNFNCAILAMILGAANLPLSYLVLQNMQIGEKPEDRGWLSLMLIFGTVHFFCAAQGSSWFLGHVATLFFLLLGLYFLTKHTAGNLIPVLNSFLAGLFFGLAVTCRLSALFGAVFFMGYLFLTKETNKKWIKMLIAFCFGAAVFGSLYMLYNYLRYESIMDMGYSLTYLKDCHPEQYALLQEAPDSEQKSLLLQYTKEFGGPLQLSFLRYNLYSILFLPPAFQKQFPQILPTLDGIAVTYTSPMLFYAFYADGKKKIIRLLFLTAGICAIPFLLNYGNGTAQFGMRYSLDFTPYLWLLMCYALTKDGALKTFAKIGIAACIFVQGYGTIYWTCFYS